MPQQPNTPNSALRLVVLVVMLLAGIAIVWSVSKNSSRSTPGSGASAPASTPAGGTVSPVVSQPGTGADGKVEPENPSKGTTASAPAAAPATSNVPPPPAAAGGYRAATFAGDPLATTFGTLGSLDAAVSKGLLEFSPVGAGIKDYELSEHFVDRKKSAPYVVQAEHVIPQVRQADGSVSAATVTPMAALGVEVNGTFVVLATSPSGPTWRQVSADRPGVFEAFVEDAGSGARVLRIERAYSVDKGYGVRVHQRLFNLSAAPMQVRWLQLGTVDLPQDSDSYGGDRRRMPAGYLLPAAVDPARQMVMSADYMSRLRTAVLGAVPPAGYAPEGDVWPDANATTKQLELSWVAMANRYYGAAVHPAFDPAVPGSSKSLSWVQGVKRVLVNPVGADGALKDPVMAYRLDSKPVTIPAGGSMDVSVGMWMGPLSKPLMKDDPVADALGLGGMVVYNMGGPCGFCTFDGITFILRSVMHFLHDSVFHDWSMAIIFLVVFVRTCLHPLTRWSQIRMQRFGKQMALMQPKQKKIQERYKDDKAKLQQEMAALWREEGVSPLGMLGCLPMLLVTPIWLSLYAMLFYAVELRNEPAFYGVIQKLTGGSWGFLSDLSHPDAFLSLGTSFSVPLMGPISSLNVLPLLLGVVFFFHQKYLSPPMTTQMTPEQETQQKMVKIMSVVMFPVFMYNSPAGLALYFTTNSTLAIIENAWIRKHINTHGLLDEDKLKRKPKDPGSKGFMQRLMEAAEEKRKLAEAKARKDQLDRGRGRK